MPLGAGVPFTPTARMVLGTVVLVVLLLLRRITLKTFVPYGPFLIIGAICAALVIQ